MSYPTRAEELGKYEYERETLIKIFGPIHCLCLFSFSSFLFLRNIFYLSLYCKVRKGCSRVACERELETEHKLHILTPLLWPSRCVFLVLLMLGSTPSGVSEGPLGRVWSSLPHLVSNCLEFYWQLLWHPTQFNYIIIQRPHDRPLDLWNRMFNRHQAEITVMQFRGYSLPVHHCSGTMGPSPCPIS